MHKKKDLIKFDLLYEEVEFVIPKTYTPFSLFRRAVEKVKKQRRISR